jgi:hypothetical protein
MGQFEMKEKNHKRSGPFVRSDETRLAVAGSCRTVKQAKYWAFLIV